LTNKNYEIFMR